MTDADLDRLVAISSKWAKTAIGPWVYREGGDPVSHSIWQDMEKTGGAGWCIARLMLTSNLDDMKAIANENGQAMADAREDVPWLIAQINWLLKENSQLHDQVDRLVSWSEFLLKRNTNEGQSL